MRPSCRSVIVASLATIFSMACAGSNSGESSAAPLSDAPTLRQTTFGTLVGVDDQTGSGTYSWKGIAYAQPPVGSLRWRAPVDPAPWEGVRSAKAFGNACLQIGRVYGPGRHNTYDDTIGTSLGQPVGSEDCLTLNIWRPADNEENLPVLLFIHGGSNVSGYSADPVYDGATLARSARAVVVTANYRLGILGFLNVQQLKSGTSKQDDSGNYGLLDILAALQYIHRNIRGFGGNPGNVTLAGQSAGAFNVYALMTSPMAAGLFHKIVAMSGGASAEPASASAARGQSLLARLVLADGKAADLAGAQAWLATQTPEQISAYLRGKDPSAVLAVSNAAGLNKVSGIIDGSVVPVNPLDAINSGAYPKVPLIAGFTRDEGKLFMSPYYKIDDAARFAMMSSLDANSPGSLSAGDIIKPENLPADQSPNGYNTIAKILTTQLVSANMQPALNAVKGQQTNVWGYRFDWAQEPAPWDTVYGAAHAFDLSFMFGNFGPSLFSRVIGSDANKPGRLALSKAWMASLAAFMHTGNPNDPALGVNWGSWPSTLVLDATPDTQRIRAE